MKKLYLSLVLLASLFSGACSSDDDCKDAHYTESTQTEAPVWAVDWSNNQERPDWTEPNAAIYENWTIIMVKIEDELKPYVSEDDRMAFFLNGELRGLAQPAISLAGEEGGDAYFLMKAYGNETGSEKVHATLQLYCHKLKHIFSLSEDIVLNSDISTGIDEDYIPLFTLGSAKYPVVKIVGVESILAKAGITPATSNLVGAFVGDECRGQVTISGATGTQLVIFGRTKGETVTLKCYDAETGRLYTIPNAVTL